MQEQCRNSMSTQTVHVPDACAGCRPQMHADDHACAVHMTSRAVSAAGSMHKGTPGNGGRKLMRKDIVALAKGWTGTPYVHRESTRGAGCDCLGLLRGVWREIYGYEPEEPPLYPADPSWHTGNTDLLADAAGRHLDVCAPESVRPGDVLVFRIDRAGFVSHCAIVTAPDRFIHAYAGRSVVESWMNRWWRERITAAFSFPGVV